MNIAEAAQFLLMHPEELRQRAKRGLVPGVKAGRRYVFIDEDLAEYLRSRYAVPGKRCAWLHLKRSQGHGHTQAKNNLVDRLRRPIRRESTKKH